MISPEMQEKIHEGPRPTERLRETAERIGGEARARADRVLSEANENLDQAYGRASSWLQDNYGKAIGIAAIAATAGVIGFLVGKGSPSREEPGQRI